jgi:cell division protein FtsW
MSYGGSGIIANCLALAVLLRVDFENRCMMKGSNLSSRNGRLAGEGRRT